MAEANGKAPAATDGAARHKPTEKIGSVVSTKMAKTIVVEVSRRVPHPLYKRIIKKRKKFYAHDEQSTAKLGDVVRIVPNHVCVVVNMMDEVVMVRGEEIVGVLPVAARGKLR